MKPGAAMQVAALLICAALPGYQAVKTASAGHPIEKVIILLGNLMSKAEQEGRDEAIVFTKFEYWCTNSLKTLETAIANEKGMIEELTSTVSSKREAEALLEEQIGGLETELGRLGVAAGDAEKLRGETADLYTKASADYVATIDAIGKAIEALEGVKASTAGLLFAQQQVRAALALGTAAAATEEQRQALVAFMELRASPERPALKAERDAEKHVKVYSFKSQNVVELLKELKMKFEDEKVAADQAETNSLNAHELSKAAQQDEIDKATAAKDTKTSELSDTKSELAKAQGDLANTQEDLKANEALFAQTEKGCSVKKTEWAERSETRRLEIEAIKAAVEILGKVTGVRTEAPVNPVLPPAPIDAEGSAGVAFLELDVSPKMQAVQLLRAAGREAHSKALERLAQEVQAHLSGPFDDIGNMIQKMIFRLMAEQKEEDVHKNWCDLELNKTETSKSDKESKMAVLAAKIEESKAQVQELTVDIQKADEMVVAITAHVDEAAEIRDVGKQENIEAVKDARDAQQAIAKAIAVLESFYKETGMVAKEPWELLQKAKRGVDLPEEPASWDSSYTGVADPKNQPDGIVTILKQVSADFAKMEAQTSAQEQSDQKLYEDDMKLNAIEKARLSKESEMKAQEKKLLVDKIASLSEKEAHVSSEHSAVEQYLKDLQHGCVDGDSTYEDRKAARSKEIDALKEAQIILRDAFKASNASMADEGQASNASTAFRLAAVRPAAVAAMRKAKASTFLRRR